MGKKEVGILTFHRAINHGAILQCYALYKTLEKQGYDVTVIDYRQPYIEEQYKYHRNIFLYSEFKKVLSNPRWIPGYIFRVLPEKYQKIKTFNKLSRKLKFTKAVNRAECIPDFFDTIIIGSDQVWANYCTNGIDEVYYGNFPHSRSKIIGYAISSNIESLKENGNEKLRDLCKNFTSIAFREEGISNYLQKNIGLRSEVVLDPTLLLDSNEWNKIIEDISIEKPRKYILTYFLNENFDRDVLDNKITTFAQERDCKVVELGSISRSPEEFVSWIKDANYIITSSFHATIFSIIFKKELYTLRTHNGKDIRYINLMHKLGMQDRVIDYEDLSHINSPIIDYKKVEDKIIQARRTSIDFLRNSL